MSLSGGGIIRPKTASLSYMVATVILKCIYSHAVHVVNLRNCLLWFPGSSDVYIAILCGMIITNQSSEDRVGSITIRKSQYRIDLVGLAIATVF